MNAQEKLDAVGEDNKRAEVGPGPQEAIYETQLSPLVEQIRAICAEHKMPLLVMVESDEGTENCFRSGTIQGAFSDLDVMAFKMLGIA